MRIFDMRLQYYRFAYFNSYVLKYGIRFHQLIDETVSIFVVYK
jgi:hypothetical protein